MSIVSFFFNIIIFEMSILFLFFFFFIFLYFKLPKKSFRGSSSKVLCTVTSHLIRLLLYGHLSQVSSLNLLRRATLRIFIHVFLVFPYDGIVIIIIIIIIKEMQLQLNMFFFLFCCPFHTIECSRCQLLLIPGVYL